MTSSPATAPPAPEVGDGVAPTAQGRQLLRGPVATPVLVAVVVALVLHLLWVVLLANGGGDLAAQDAWAGFARAHPRMAYDLAWYGGMHPVSYSVLSPYVMALLGVRTTMILAGVASAGILALLLARSGTLRNPVVPAVYGAFAIAGNAVSGRATFALGVMFGLAAVAVLYAPVPDETEVIARRHRRLRAALAALLSALSTASSPVAGLFVGVVAAALWLGGRRRAGYALGIPPVVVVGLSTLYFPFSGEQPMAVRSMVLPLVIGLACALLPPRSWRTVRIGAWLYCAGVVLVLLVPSEIGSNVTRLALIFGGVVLVAVASEAWRAPAAVGAPSGRPARVALALTLCAATVWQVGIATADVVSTRSASVWTGEVAPLVAQLRTRHADLARVEVVPSRSHREAAALAPYVNLARGWNRQADAGRNPLFYTEGALTATSYRGWLDRWAVQFVFLPDGEPDPAAIDEAALVARGLPYLKHVWTGAGGRLYAVRSAVPLVDPPATVVSFGAGEVVVRVTQAGRVRLRILYSPWLALVDETGRTIDAPEPLLPGGPAVNVDGCLTKIAEPEPLDDKDQLWTVLDAPSPGTYRIATPYTLPRGTACVEDE